MTSELGMSELTNGVRYCAVKFSVRREDSVASKKVVEIGRTSARTDSRLIMTTLRMGVLRYALGEAERSTSGAHIFPAT